MVHILHYTRDDFYGMSLSDIVYLIEQHKEANKDQYDHANKNKQQTTKGETEFYGVDPETLKRWAEEDSG